MALERVPADIRAQGGVARMVHSSSFGSKTFLILSYRAIHSKRLTFSTPSQKKTWISLIKEIINAVTIPVMAKSRIGHFVEAQVCMIPTYMPSS